AVAPGLEGAVEARRESLVKAFRGSGPLLERAEVGTVRVVISEFGSIAILTQGLEVALVELIVDVHPLVDHEGLALGKTLADLGALFGGEFEIVQGVFLLAGWQVCAMHRYSS